jgi:oligopeptide transport system permease protein
MFKYVVRRLIWMIPILWIIATASFFMIRSAPGGPFDKERKMPPGVMRNIEAKYHMDEPLWQQYLRYMGDLAHGDLGPSYKYPGRTVNEIIASGAPNSAQVGALAILVALLIGIPAGIISALKQNSWGDYLAMSFAMFGISIPNFVLGPILIMIFALGLGILPVAGWGQPQNLIMPAVTLGTAYAAFVARLTRSGMLEVIRQNYIRTARAKGLSERVVIIRHALKGGLLPVVSFLGPAAAGLLTGTIIVETIFNVPGIGRFFLSSALNRDYTTVLGTVLLYSTVLILFNLLVDIAYAFLDPRVRYS